MTAALILLTPALYLWAFWGLYVLVMGLYRAHLNNRLNRLCFILGAPFIATGLLVDVLANIVICTAVFFELPREWLVTQRLTRYLRFNTDWRASVALFICEKLLDVFDPTGEHCK